VNVKTCKTLTSSSTTSRRLSTTTISNELLLCHVKCNNFYDLCNDSVDKVVLFSVVSVCECVGVFACQHDNC